ETGRASRFHRDRHARFGNELLRGLVEANQRTIAVAWPRVDGQHVFHSGYERAVGLRRDDPVLAAMGLERVFLSARPIVLSLARSTMPSSTTFFSNNRKVQRARPLGGLEQAKAISLASFSPSKIRAMAGIARGLRLNTVSKPSSTSCLPHPINHGWAGFQSFDDPVVAPPFASFRDTGFQQDPPLQPQARRAFSFPNQRFKPFAFLAAQPHNILLYRNLLRSHDCLPRQSLATKTNHQILSNWLKRATSCRSQAGARPGSLPLAPTWPLSLRVWGL